MKKFSFTKLTTLLVIALAQAAVAQNYNFTFTGNDGIDATGTISISGGVAQSGSTMLRGFHSKQTQACSPPRQGIC